MSSGGEVVAVGPGEESVEAEEWEWDARGLAEGRLVLGEWRLGRKLGQGGYGSVYAAWRVAKDEADVETKAAVKMEGSGGGRLSSLVLEARVLWDVRGHRGLPRLFAAGQEGGLGVVVMELLGPSLATLKRARPGQHFSFPTTLEIAVQLLAAMGHIHDRGWLHRDMKPSNLCLSLDGRRVVLVDFGLSRRHLGLDGAPRDPRRRKVGFRGTHRYAAPNVHRGREASRADDLVSALYSLAELASGRLPWRGRSSTASVLRLKLHPPAPVFPPPFHLSPLPHILRHLSLLRYHHRPPYADYLRSLHSFAQQHDYDSVPLDWLPNTA